MDGSIFGSPLWVFFFFVDKDGSQEFAKMDKRSGRTSSSNESSCLQCCQCGECDVVKTNIRLIAGCPIARLQ